MCSSRNALPSTSTEKIIYVVQDDDCVKVKYSNFENLKSETKTKFELLADFYLYYQEEEGRWIRICNDKDLDDISSKAELRLVIKGKKETSIGNNYATHGAAAIGGNALYVGGDVHGKSDYVKGDKIDTQIVVKHCSEFMNMSQNSHGELKEKVIKQSCETYKRDLWEYAEFEAVIMNIYSGCKVSIVKLQITSTELQRQNKEGIHLYHRADRAELMSRNVVGDVEVEKLFEKAYKLAEEKALNIDFQNIPNAREKFIKEEGNRVIISGQAGSGKTTLSKDILGKVVGDKRLFKMDFVFYLVLREVDYNRKVSFLRFLAPIVSYDDNQQRSLLDTINDCDKVLIIMDGLDESGIDFTTSHQSVSIHDEATAEVFIKNLLKGTFLPNAKKLVFSRPGTVAELLDLYKPLLVATILGLNHDAQRQMCRNYCKKNPEKVYQHIKDNSDLLEYCQTPLNLILTTHNINRIALNNSTKIYTFTDVLTFTLQWLAYNKNHRRGNFDAKSIAALAWNGFNKDKFTFTQEDFSKDFNQDDLFIATNETKLSLLDGNPEIKVCFSHLLLQEFFVALHLLYFMELEEFLENSLNFTGNKFEMVTKIMFGLCNEQTNEQIQQIISSGFYSKEKVYVLKSMFETKFFNVIDEKVLRYFLWAYELKDDRLTKKLASCLSDRVDVSCRMLPSDVAAFHYVCGMREQQSITFQSLSHRNFYGDCWHQFLSDEKLPQYLNEVGKLELGSNEISANSALVLLQFSNKVQHLHLWGNSLVNIKRKTLFYEIADIVEKMKNLQITNNQTDDDDDAAHASAQGSHRFRSLEY